MNRRVILLIIYALVFMFVGRNLTLLPSFGPAEATPEEKVDARIGKLKEFLKTQEGNFSVYYKDLKTGKSFGLNEHKVVTGASLNKLVIVAHLYNLAKEKKVNLEDIVVVQKKDIQDYGTGPLRYQKPGKAYSLKSLAQYTLNQSDNTASRLLALRLGKPATQEYAESLGLVATDMEDNKTTAADMGKMLELIYTGKVTSPSLTQELLDFLKDTDFEDRLARTISNRATVHHKTGDAVGKIHDSGIIVPNHAAKSPFILSVMSIDIKDEEKAKEAIGKIAEIMMEDGN